jgi:hypothetical protein
LDQGFDLGYFAFLQQVDIVSISPNRLVGKMSLAHQVLGARNREIDGLARGFGFHEPHVIKTCGARWRWGDAVEDDAVQHRSG